MKKLAHKRHIVKAFSWRIVGTIDTIILSWFLSGNLYIGVKVGGLELITKIVLYYLHDRAWYEFVRAEKMRSTVRHAIKAITWRIVGTLDTIFLGYFITGNLNLGVKIGVFELVTKSVIYFLHERLWYRSNFGLIKEKTEIEVKTEMEVAK
ncbi:MAG: DUF2061 domain-containing protein [Flavobacterium sp.]